MDEVFDPLDGRRSLASLERGGFIKSEFFSSSMIVSLLVLLVGMYALYELIWFQIPRIEKTLHPDDPGFLHAPQVGLSTSADTPGEVNRSGISRLGNFLDAKARAESDGFCYVGDDRGTRVCAPVKLGESCESGEIFSNPLMCAHPNLRQ